MTSPRWLRLDRLPVSENKIAELAFFLWDERARRHELRQPSTADHYDHQTGTWIAEGTGIPKTEIYRIHEHMLSRPSASDPIAGIAERYGFRLEAIKKQLFRIERIKPRIVDSEVWERDEATLDIGGNRLDGDR